MVHKRLTLAPFASDPDATRSRSTTVMGMGCNTTALLATTPSRMKTAPFWPKSSKEATLVPKRFTIAWRRTPLKAHRHCVQLQRRRDEDNGSCVYASGDYCSGASDGSGSVVDGDSDDDGVMQTKSQAAKKEPAITTVTLPTLPHEYAADGFDCEGNPLP